MSNEDAVEILMKMMQGYASFSQRLALGKAIKCLKEPPTEIIRCNECKHQSYVACEGINGGYNPNAFCSFAERKCKND